MASLFQGSEICSNIANYFSCLTDQDFYDNECDNKAHVLLDKYPDDIDNGFLNEILQFRAYIKRKFDSSTGTGTGTGTLTRQLLYDIIFQDDIKYVFPNTEIVLRIYLTLMVTNCSGERSFSCLKRIKSDLRTSMDENRLSSLALMSMEVDKLRDIQAQGPY